MKDVLKLTAAVISTKLKAVDFKDFNENRFAFKSNSVADHFKGTEIQSLSKNKLLYYLIEYMKY